MLEGDKGITRKYRNHAAARSTHNRVSGMFSYYSKWISKFSEKVSPLLHASTFPLDDDELNSFQRLKDALVNVFLGAIAVDLPLKSRSTHQIVLWRPYCCKMGGQWHLCPEG